MESSASLESKSMRLKLRIVLKVVFGFFSIFVLVVLFQNCGQYQSKFSKDEFSSQNSELNSSTPAGPISGGSGNGSGVANPPADIGQPKSQPRRPIQFATNRPMGSNYPAASLAWDESYYLSSLLLRFEREKNISALDEFFYRVSLLKNTREDKVRLRGSRPIWTSRGSEEAKYQLPPADCVIVGMDAMTLNPLSEFISLYHNKKNLFDGLAYPTYQLDEIKSDYISFIRETMNFHIAGSWNSALGTYKYHSSSRCVDSQGRADQGMNRLPFNLIAAAGRIHFRLFEATQTADDLARVVAIAQDLKASFRYGSLGQVSWPYHTIDPIESIPEDLSHGAIVAEFIKLMADRNMVFSSDDLDALDKTVRYHIMSSSNVIYHYIGFRKNVFYGCLDPAKPGDYIACRSLAQWFPLMKNPDWIVAAKRYVHPDNSDYSSLVRELLQKY
jgi:hypothetical protein